MIQTGYYTLGNDCVHEQNQCALRSVGRSNTRLLLIVYKAWWWAKANPPGIAIGRLLSLCTKNKIQTKRTKRNPLINREPDCSEATGKNTLATVELTCQLAARKSCYRRFLPSPERCEHQEWGRYSVPAEMRRQQPQQDQ